MKITERPTRANSLPNAHGAAVGLSSRKRTPSGNPL